MPSAHAHLFHPTLYNDPQSMATSPSHFRYMTYYLMVIRVLCMLAAPVWKVRLVPGPQVSLLQQLTLEGQVKLVSLVPSNHPSLSSGSQHLFRQLRSRHACLLMFSRESHPFHSFSLQNLGKQEPKMALMVHTCNFNIGRPK